MHSPITQLVVWLNCFANLLGGVFLAPIAWLPGWVSATTIASITGVLILVAFKYTSNQTAIKRTRDQIKANILALSLFRDDLWVSLRCQGRMFREALRLLSQSLLPLAAMTVPMLLLLGQLALWYQARPLGIREEAIVTVILRDGNTAALNEVTLLPADTLTIVAGPVRIPPRNMVCWNVAPTQEGRHEMRFDAGGQSFTKEIVAGGTFRQTSRKRPSWNLNEVMLHPFEPPFAAQSIVQSIEVTYPERDSLTSGSNSWIIYWLIVSLIAAFAAKPFLGVNI